MSDLPLPCGVEPDGAVFETATSWLRPVFWRGQPAMAKRLKPHSDEAAGAAFLAHWCGEGAVRLYFAQGDTLIMERATGTASLRALVLSGGDDGAADVLAATIRRLHGAAGTPPAAAEPLAARFRALFERAGVHPTLAAGASVAETLLAMPQGSPIALHGDLHHGNLLDGGARGWLAIDPKGVVGERTYEVANLLRNPSPVVEVVLDSERALRHAGLYGQRLGLDAGRILRFAHAHAALSAAWDLEDGVDPTFSLACARMLDDLTRVRIG